MKALKGFTIASVALIGSHAHAKEFSKADFEKSVAALKKHAAIGFDESELYNAALQGVLSKIEASLNEGVHRRDQANALLDPRTLKEMKNDLKGDITGIGASIEFDKSKGQKYPQIIGLINKGGAKKAGIKPGDQLLKVNGKPTSAFNSFREVIYAIRGKAGSSIKLTLLRDSEVIQKSVVRHKLNYKPAEISYPKKNTALLKINYFNQKTPDVVEGLLKKANKSSNKGMVLDLRTCGGGALQQGEQTLDLFAKKGVTLLKKKTKSKVDLVKSKTAPLYNGKLVVLVGGGTQSMCEAFAASLRANQKATIIGQPTYGKASVETIYEIGNGYAAKFTVAKLQDPNGQSWQGSGVIPDVQVSTEQEESTLQAAMHFLDI